jgi:hypothetical protein
VGLPSAGNDKERTLRATRKHLLAAGAVALGVGGLFMAPAMAQDKDHKITICHVPPGNPANAHEISIDLNAWENGHSQHSAHGGDFVVDADHQCPAVVVAETTTTTTTILGDL